MELSFVILKDTYAICKFKTNTDIAPWIKNSDFYSVTQNEDELSVVCKESDLHGDMSGYNKDWRILKILGPLDLSITGIIAGISALLNEKKISIFTISTYDTDYLLVKNADLDKTIVTLAADGHIVISDE